MENDLSINKYGSAYLTIAILDVKNVAKGEG